MAQDITSSIDQSGIVDGATIDAADVTTALNNFITVINAMLNGGQAFDRMLFEAAETLTISGGVVTAPTKALVILAAESGTSDSVDTIDASNNRCAVFKADSGDTITLNNASGNIYGGAANVVLTGNAIALGFCLGGTWSIISSDNAPSGANYIVQTPSDGLSGEQALSLLATGIVKNTTTSGVLSIAAAGTDYQAPLKTAIIQDQKASGTAGGASSATTWNTRDLNTEVYDAGNLVTLSSNKFTPISGTYKIRVTATAFQAGVNRLRLYNVTGAATVDEGMNSQSTTSVAMQNIATLETIFTANGTDEYRIDHYTNSAQASDGLGRAVTTGGVERYCTVVLDKIA